MDLIVIYLSISVINYNEISFVGIRTISVTELPKSLVVDYGIFQERSTIIIPVHIFDSNV